jgi:hypothetical protein
MQFKLYFGESQKLVSQAISVVNRNTITEITLSPSLARAAFTFVSQE